jgi:transcriptional regulator with XRE-family HTH domain
VLRKLAQGSTVVHMTTDQIGNVVPAWTVGDRLRKARETSGLEQGPFAEKIGVSRGTVSNYERGTTSNYKLIVLRAWALATGVALEWIETGVHPSGPTTPPEGPRGASDELARLTQQKRSRTRGTTTRRYLAASAQAA